MVSVLSSSTESDLRGRCVLFRGRVGGRGRGREKKERERGRERKKERGEVVIEEGEVQCVFCVWVGVIIIQKCMVQ